jgi:hypothetical protein
MPLKNLTAKLSFQGINMSNHRRPVDPQVISCGTYRAKFGHLISGAYLSPSIHDFPIQKNVTKVNNCYLRTNSQHVYASNALSYKTHISYTQLYHPKE